MRMAFLILAGLFFVTALASSPARAGEAQILGTGLGAAFGGLIGSQIGQGSGQLVATGVGVAAGGLIGNSIGRQIDRPATPPTYYSGGRNYFVNDTAPGAYYEPNYVAPPSAPPTYINKSDESYCRPYSQEIIIDGIVQESYGTACLQPDGTWRIVP